MMRKKGGGGFEVKKAKLDGVGLYLCHRSHPFCFSLKKTVSLRILSWEASDPARE